MQKKLLALAIAGAMAAPLAAQAQGSNVTIYGFLKPSIDMVDDGDESGVIVSSNNSLIGFSGSEDLGNGLKAIFQLESNADFTDRGDNDGDEQLVRRDSWLGLSGSFGSVTLGNHQTAYVRVSASYDPFADTIGDYNNILGVSAVGNGSDFNSRFRNSVYYTSPNWSGFQLLASYALGTDADGDGFEDDGDDPDNDTLSLGLTYTWGPVGFLVGYEDGGANATGDDREAWKLGVTYKFGSTSLYAIYADEEFTSNGDRDAWFVAIKHSIGKIDLMASYTSADELSEINDSGADAFALGAAYNLSKRTAIIAVYANVNNDDDAAPRFGFDSVRGGFTPAGGEDTVSGFSVGMRHRF